MASAIAAARQRINDVGADGDLDGARARGEIDLEVDSIADPIELPDGKLIYPPKLHGEPIDRIACALLDMQQPSRSRSCACSARPVVVHSAPFRSGSEQSVQGGRGNVDGEPFAAAAGDVDGVRVRRVGPCATRSGGRSRAPGGVGEREIAVGDVGHEAGADLVGEADPPGRVRAWSARRAAARRAASGGW